MDFKKLKNLVKQNGDKFVFVEDGEPEIVMMSFKEYEKIVARDPNPEMHLNDSSNDFSRAGTYSKNLDVQFDSPETYKEPHFAEFASGLGIGDTEVVTPDFESAGLPVRLEDIRLEDLPI